VVLCAKINSQFYKSSKKLRHLSESVKLQKIKLEFIKPEKVKLSATIKYLRNPKNLKFHGFSGVVLKISVQIVKKIACSTLLVNAYERKITFDSLQWLDST
jgi:hypothetical protein